jgi:hypothetical protein
MYLPIYSIYLLPLGFLPFHEYFIYFKKLSFYRNSLNVFDKINAPQFQFVEKSRAINELHKNEFSNIQISAYGGFSWRICGVKL